MFGVRIRRFEVREFIHVGLQLIQIKEIQDGSHMGAYYGKMVFVDLLDDFEFLTKNGTTDHAKFSHHINILITQ